MPARSRRSASPGRSKARRSTAKPHVLVVGGGIMGTSCALALARRGAAVTVLEKSSPGAEASSAAAGILGAQLECTAPGPLYELCRASMRLYPSWVKQLTEDTGIDVGYRPGGTMSVVFDRAAITGAHRRFAWQAPEGSVERVGRRRLLELEPALSPALAGGVLLEEDARITPPLLYRATHSAAARAGVTFRTGAFVRRVFTEGERVRGVALDDGTLLEADVVGVAAGSRTSLVEGISLGSSRVVPARGQIVELESPAPVLSRVVCGPRCYLIPRDDGRTLIGSTLEFVGYQRNVTARGVRDLLGAAIELVPALADASLRGTWSNFRPYTADHLPLIGRGALEGLLIASGHYRNGILLAPATAETIA